MSQNLTEWRPPQEKYVRWAVTGGLALAVITIVSMAVKAVVPTWIDALTLLNSLLSNMTSLVIAGVILTGVVWLAYEIVSPSGRINRLFAQAYSSLISKLTWELLNIDPITPLTDKRREMVEKKETFDEAFADFDGTISHLQNTESRYRTDASKAERQAKAAEKLRHEDPTKEAAFQRLAYESGRYRETADQFANMRLRLEPVRATISKVQEALGVMISNIDIDIRIARDTWEAQGNMVKMDKAARGIMKTSREELAQNAMELIHQKYGESLGRLENLTDLTKPFLDSIDLNKASYSEELLSQWQSESQKLLEAPKGEAIPVQVTPVAESQSAFSNLIR